MLFSTVLVVAKSRRSRNDADALAYRAIAKRFPDAQAYVAQVMDHVWNVRHDSVWHAILDDAVRLRQQVADLQKRVAELEGHEGFESQYIDIEKALLAFGAHLFDGHPLPDPPERVISPWTVEIRGLYDQSLKHTKKFLTRENAIDFARSIWKRTRKGEHIEPWVYDPYDVKVSDPDF